MYQVSELVDLMIAVVLSPIIVVIARRIRTAGTDWAAAGTLCVFASYVFTVVEGYVAQDVFNFLEHFALAAAGISFAIAGVQLYRVGKSQGRL